MTREQLPAGRRRPESFGRRMTDLAATHPATSAIIAVDRSGAERQLSWAELEASANRVARLLTACGVTATSCVAVALANGLTHYVVTWASWKLGAFVLPLNPALPPPERDQLLALAQPDLVVGHWPALPTTALSPAQLVTAETCAATPLPDRIPNPGKAIASGGSTGRPKLIVTPGPWVRVPQADAEAATTGMRRGQVQLVAGPLYHNGAFLRSHWGLFDDHTLVVLERFDAALAVELIERHRVNWAFMVPTMLQRIARLPGIRSRDLSSIEGIFHSGGPCPPWVKRAWIELIGGERVFEVFGATEALGATAIRGDEWLEHPGSVGRPVGCELRILDKLGGDVPVGTVGEIFMRPELPVEQCYAYIGSPPATMTPDGFASVGDLGWVDEQGYLYLADRRVDMIVSGGANVYPAEVEAALSEHPDVVDVAVIGIPDDDWGRRVHAVVQLRAGAAPDEGALKAHVRERLAAYKAPKTYEFVPALPRDASGKIRRSLLAAERAGGRSSAHQPARA